MAGPLQNLQQAALDGKAFNVSYQEVVGNGAGIVLHLDHPTNSDLDWFIEPPAISGDGSAQIRVWENATPSNLQGDVFVHNIKYDEQEEPDGRVDRPATMSDLDTASADQTFTGFILQGGATLQQSAAPSDRGFWRIVPGTESISIVIENTSGGNNRYEFNTVVYEAEGWP